MPNYLSNENIRRMTPQQAQVMLYIDAYGSITPMEAFYDLGITKLATRVSELKKLGYKFDQEMVVSNNRFGAVVHYMKYSFPKELINEI